jgi:hypothetical protein
MSAPNCFRKGCTRIRSQFSLFLNRRRAPRFENRPFCSESCLLSHLESELSEKWRQQLKEKNRRIPRPRLGAILLQTASITSGQLQEAVRLQQQSQEGRLGYWLQRLGFVEERQITQALSRQYGIPLINLRHTEANAGAVKMVPATVARCSNLLPVGFDSDKDALRIAVTAPVNFKTHEAIRRMLRKGVSTYIGDESAITSLLEQWYQPDDLDLENAPCFCTLEELQGIARTIVSTAVTQRAHNIQAELLDSFFWARVDWDGRTQHYFYRHRSPAADVQGPLEGNWRQAAGAVPAGIC